MSLPNAIKERGDFTIRDLLKKLEKAGFFSNRVSLLKYEKMGIIPKARRYKVNAWEYRVYSKDEMNEIVKILRSLPIRKSINVES